MKKVTTKACANIALIKYWGKKDHSLNIPDVPSLSLTLDALQTITTVELDPGLQEDVVILNGREDVKTSERIKSFLNMVRTENARQGYVKIITSNNFPTGAGLASSASGFAALAKGISEIYDLNLDERALSILARKGSGSAARSIFGGIVEMKSGEKPDGSDSFAVPLYDANYWDLRIIIVITTEKEKKIKSTEGMMRSRATSPFYSAWVDTQLDDMNEAKIALKNRDIQRLGEVIEHNCFKMHAVMMSSRPSILYWNGVTVELIHYIQELRKHNIPGYVTIDAGPQIKILTTSKYVEEISNKVKGFPGVKGIILSGLGEGVKIIESIHD